MKTDKEIKLLKMAVKAINYRIGILVIAPDPNKENEKKIAELIEAANYIMELTKQ